MKKENSNLAGLVTSLTKDELVELNSLLKTMKSPESIEESYVIDSLTDIQKRVLSETVSEFFKKNVNINVKIGYRFTPLCNAIGHTKNVRHRYIRVYDALGCDREALKKYRLVDDGILDAFENALNIYGLSLKNKLSKELEDELSSENRFDFNRIR